MWRHGAGRLLRRHDDEWAKLPFAVEQVQTDNGQEFGQAFHWHLLDKGLGHIRIKPRTPPLNGKVERSQRIDLEEFYRLLAGQVIDDVNLFTSKLQEWGTTTTTTPPRRPRRPDPLRTPATEGPGPPVIGVRQLHN
ncbi:hypothetical protein AB0919_17740 [Streptomyces sp. NPDC046994]|uniref:hypothetical protein n=1 Tax=Streptomyces sp. NPDC046994 TaxID=3155735 RepID=UPI0034543451